MMLLNGKNAIITGAAGEVAEATAKLFRRHGARLFLTDVSAQALRDRAETLGGEAEGVYCGSADVTSAEDVRNTVKSAVDVMGGVDILVNSAGINPPGDLLDVTAEDWDKIMAVNLRGTMLMIQAVARHMIETGRNGSIVNVASLAGRVPRPPLLAYGASKAGVIYLTRTAAVGLGPKGIRVNAVAPSAIDTRMLRVAAQTSGPAEGLTPEEWLSSWSTKVPLGRLATPSDVANAILFLASDEAAFISGQTLGVTGGMIID
ncbi:MAG: SDR family oxidoreductase [Armatimonadetes bacterium]|nr:SDR family oxidoreductase [Armatimonadota bacterium]